MTAKSDAFDNAYMLLVFNNTNAANIGDATGLRGSTAAGSLYFSLHTADPGAAGDQTTNEAAYTPYARIGAARSSGGFTVSGNAVSPAANVDYAKCTASPGNPLTHWALGTSLSGAGEILYRGGIGPAPVPMTAVASSDLITVPNQAFSVDDRVQFLSLQGLSLPAGITEGTVYWVKTVSGNAITVSTSQGGATLNITADGAGFAQLIQPITMAINVIPRLETTTTIREG